MSDEIEGVRRTLALYCQLMDDGRHDEVADLFDHGARWLVGGQVHAGIAEIRAAMASWPVRSGVKHLTVNSVIDVEGDGAVAVSDFILVHATEIGGVTMRAGRYHDTLLRDGAGVWRFSSRENRGTSFVAESH